ncbi:nucleolar protein 3 isoform X3 [Notamacropus eugenii]
MGNVQERPSDMIQRERKQLVEVLKNDSVILLDGLMARGILTVSEYESLDAMDDPERRMRRILLIVQQKGYSHHHQRSHDSCFVNDERKISCGGTCIGVPNSADEDKTDGVEGSQVSEAAELDTLEDQEYSKDPEPESQSVEDNESANEVVEEPEPQNLENNDLSEWSMEPEPEHGDVVEDDGEGAAADEDF